jgi:TPR repeat protein
MLYNFYILLFVGVSITSSNKVIATQSSQKKVESFRINIIDIVKPEDSSNIYHVLGWKAYKAQKFGAARYYWELGSGCNTSVTTKYDCAFRLGLLHQTGEGVGKNPELAFYYYNLAYANGQRVGNVDATKNIASYYENGIYVPKDINKALEWYQKAKAQGNKYCDADIARVTKFLAKPGV